MTHRPLSPSALPEAAAQRIEQLCLRFTAAWQVPRIEDFLGTIEEPERSVLLHELLARERALRIQAGQRPTMEEYLDRFPAEVVQSVFAEAIQEGVPLLQVPTRWGVPGAPAVNGVTTQQTLAARPGEVSGMPSTEPAAHLPQLPGYEILEELGRGGVGIVFKARHLALNRLCAVKRIQAEGCASALDWERFRHAGEAIARLQHPNIVQVYAVGEVDGHVSICMEFVGGGSLAQRMDRRPQSPRQSAQLIATLARAIHHAQERGVIHGDLKPANILFAEDGTPRITDFGLATLCDAVRGVKPNNAILGTPNYLAPEQARLTGGTVGPATDVWALGAILYEALAGRPPFRADALLDTLVQVVAEEPAAPSRHGSKVPAELDDICLQCLRKEPRARYRNALALAEDLERFLAGQHPEARVHSTRTRQKQFEAQVVSWLIWLVGLSLCAVYVTILLLAEGSVEKVFELGAMVCAYCALVIRLGFWARAQLAPDTAGTLRGHKGKVYAVAFRPDGAHLASAGENGIVKVWDMATGSPWATLTGHRGTVFTVAWSPDGTILATGGMDGSVRLWEAATGKPRATLLTGQRWVYALAFSPDGRMLVVGKGDGSIEVWDIGAGEKQHTFSRSAGMRSAVHALRFTRDGRLLASWHQNFTATLWQFPEGKEGLSVWAGDGDADDLFPALVFVQEDRLLVTGGGIPIRVWNTTTGQQVEREEFNAGISLSEFVSGSQPARCLSTSPDGKLLAAGVGRTVLLWDVEKRKVRNHFEGHRSDVTGLAFSPDGLTLASAGADGTVRLWDPTGTPLPKKPSGWRGWFTRRKDRASSR